MMLSYAVPCTYIIFFQDGVAAAEASASRENESTDPEQATVRQENKVKEKKIKNMASNDEMNREGVYVLAHGLYVLAVVAWMIMLLVNVVSYGRFAQLSETDILAGNAPCIVLQLLLLIVSMRLVKFKAVDALVSYISFLLPYYYIQRSFCHIAYYYIQRH
jgi:hypothetical protein